MDTRGTFNRDQVEQLLQPIRGQRVLKDGKGHSHVSQQDITAHLIRMFGFGNFDIEVLDASLVYESERVDPKTGATLNRFDVCYRGLVRLTVRNSDGVTVGRYENGSMGTAQNQSRGDGHDLAYKSAISLSIKRAAIALGDQFGLSLYNKGQTSGLVLKTLVGHDSNVGDVQADVPQQVAMGNDEIEHEPVTEAKPKMFDIAAFISDLSKAETREDLNKMWPSYAAYADVEFLHNDFTVTPKSLMQSRATELGGK
jgi:hypothetical protein